MSQVASIVPEDIVEHTASSLFLILLVTSSQTMAWYANGFHSANEEGFSNLGLFKKNSVAQEYYHALEIAKAEQTDLYAGNLEIVALPNFQGAKI